jgi:nicotinamidase-related amidase
MSASIPALIIVDMQRGMSGPSAGRRNNAEAEANISVLLAAWRAAKLPVVHVRYVSATPGLPFWPGQIGVEFQS